MKIENLQSQVAALLLQANGSGNHTSVAPDNHVSLLQNISTILDAMANIHAEIEQRMALQYAVMRVLADSIGAKEAYIKVLQATCEVIEAELGVLWILDPDTGLLYVEDIWQETESPDSQLINVSHSLKLLPGQELPGTIFFINKPVWITDIINDFNLHPLRREAALSEGMCSALLFPIRKEDAVVGVIECFSSQNRVPASNLLEVLDILGNQIGSFMERKYAEELLERREHQQAIVATLGQRALMGIELQELLDEAAELVTITLSADFCKVLELIPEENRLLLRAGVGWKEGKVGTEYLDSGPNSQAGYALSINSPVIVNDLSEETRFHASPILVEHGIISGLSVVIPGHLQPFGILSAHSATRRIFTEDDVHFLEAVAHVLATAIERRNAEEALRLSRNEIAIILDGIADGITAQNPDGKLIYANDAAARIVGYESAEELVNVSLEHMMPRFAMFDENGMLLSADRLPGRMALGGETPDPLTVRFQILETGEERWSVVKAQAVRDEDGEIVMAVNIFQDITDLKRTEMAQRLLAEASNLLDESLDYETRLISLAELVVPRLADWCSVDILNETGVLERVAVSHIDPAKVAWAHELHKHYPPDPNGEKGIYNIIRTGRALYTPVFTQEMLNALDDKRKEIVTQLGLSSIIQVPLIAGGNVLGVLGLVWAESGHHYTRTDLVLAEDLARRAALAIDNARLYAKAQRLNTELEQRVQERTSQLQTSNLRLKDQIKERKQAEKQIRHLNAELEQRVAERTQQLENANQDLQHEIIEREQIDKALQLSLEKTRELYEISQNISMIRTPEDVIKVLLTSSYLEATVRASIAIFETAWAEGSPPPKNCIVLAEWNKDPNATLYVGTRATLPEFVLIESSSGYEPLMMPNILDMLELPEITRQNLRDLGVVSCAIFPLIAGGERYGLLTLHFKKAGIFSAEDIRSLRGLVDQSAVAIYNFRLLQAEAKARQEAEEANNLKLKFLAMISHELRTPLTSIKGFATTLLADDMEWQVEQQHDFIQTIDLEADKLTDLIEQLLDLSRLEAGTMRIVPQLIHWESILATAMAQLQALTVNHQLIINTQPVLPILKVDAIRIPQVLTNLVSNAVKYSPPHTTIALSARKLSDRFIQVSISDQGSGIPPEAHTRVFEAFQQLEQEKRAARGAGLGLAICRGLIDAHGGRIWVDQHIGPGTTISFTLPTYLADIKFKS